MTSTASETAMIGQAAELVIGGRNYRWSSLWDGYQGTGWSHSGIAALSDDSVVFAHPEGHKLMRIHADGRAEEIPTELTEMHGIVATGEPGSETLWVADNGTRYCHGEPDDGDEISVGRVVELDLDGSIRQEIACPQLPEYAGKGWHPTTVDVDRESGEVWVGDGYGASLVHCFAADGSLKLTLDGTATGTHFASPHGIRLRSRDGEKELYVADRGNRRIVVFGLDGGFRRILGEGRLTSPSSITDLDGTLLVTELRGAVAVFDGDRFTGHVGSSLRGTDEAAWPNCRDENGNVAQVTVAAGTFNSPHGITVHKGQILLTEWLVGGRFTRLSPQE